ncbi:MAG: hypothetical protein EPN55_02545 [Gammaproteobacteria bacterium]|nr:MAG: hypothetical protein EPN55_02545 [Gammaproteobacteria bacterium]
MKIIDVFLSRPNRVPEHVEKQFSMFYPLLEENGFRPRTIGMDVVPISTPFQHVVNLMNQCQCTIVLGLPQIWVATGRLKGKEIEKSFSLPTEWNQIEAAISIMLNKPTLMMLHKGVSARGLFERGAANVFVHEFHTLGPKWVKEIEPKLVALRESI